MKSKQILKLRKKLMVMSVFGALLTSCNNGSAHQSTADVADVETSQVIPLPQTGANEASTGFTTTGVQWPNPRFTVGSGSETGCIKDNLTGLMWVEDANSVVLTEEQTNGAPTYKSNVYQSISQNYQNNGSYCGHSDWRIPNNNELLSLVNYGSTGTQSAWLRSQGFLNISSSDMYWSSDSGSLETDHENFAFEASDGKIKNPVTNTTSKVLARLLPVRTMSTPGLITVLKTNPSAAGHGAWPQKRFSIVGSDRNCIKDNLTGLVWLRDFNLMNTTMSYSATITAVTKLNICGYSDWRVPNINELKTLLNVDASPSNGAWLKMMGFKNLSSIFMNVPGNFWSSTNYVPSAGAQAWSIDLYYGDIHNGDQTSSTLNYLLPVRGGL